MSSATLTLLGLYQYGKRKGDDMFDSLTFPTGIDKDLAVQNILHECGDYEVLYPDYEFMKQLMELFSLKWQRTFEKWIAVQSINYEPLDNYDRKEAWSDSTSESTSENTSLSTSESISASNSLSSSESTSTSANDSTSESTSALNDISAFNASTLQPDTSQAVNAQTAGNSSTQSTGQRSEQSSDYNRRGLESGEDRNGLLDRMFEHRGRVHGNIGVKTTQSIYLEEWELDKLNIYDEIMVLFAREFLIPFTY